MAKMGRPKKWTKQRIKALADKLFDYTERENLPLFEEFCYQNGINEQKISELSAVDKNFQEAAEHLKHKQKTVLVKGGVADKFNASMTQFVLMNNHGMRTKSESDGTLKVTHEGFISDVIRKSKEVA